MGKPEMYRRDLFVALPSSIAVCMVQMMRYSFAQEQPDEALITRAIGVINSVLPTERGLLPPTLLESQRARSILSNAPPGPCHPFKVAKWFLTLDVDDVTETPSGPNFRANPIIVDFFTDATTLDQPQGDETWWCAAFVNWCLRQAKQDRTRSAASSSFRQWHKVAEPAQLGDIAVFQHSADPSHGHVAFFVGFDVDNNLLVLGGNQRNGGRPMICVHAYPRKSSAMALLSFHRDPFWPPLT